MQSAITADTSSLEKAAVEEAELAAMKQHHKIYCLQLHIFNRHKFDAWVGV